MPFKSKLQQRYMEFLHSKGKLPKSINIHEMEDKTDFQGLPEHKFSGGEIGDHDMEEEFHDGDWNDHEDTSGEPEDDFHMHGYAFGGKVSAQENDEPMESLHGKDYGRPNYMGPEDHEEGMEEMPEHEVKRHLAKALMRRKQIGSRGV